MSIPDSNSLDVTGNITLAIWVNFDAYPQKNPRLFQKQNSISSGNVTAYACWVSTTGGNVVICRFDIGGTDYDVTTATGLQTGQWYHVVAVREGSQMLMYLNGVRDGAITTIPAGSLSTNNNALLVGESPGNSDGAVDGSIDEVRIYNRALSAQEVKRLYEMGR